MKTHYLLVSLILASQTLVSAASTKSNTSLSVSTHRVLSKDTLFGIAKRYHTTVAALKAANGLNSDVIRVGSLLKISSAAVASSGSAQKPVEAKDNGTVLSAPAKSSKVGGQDTHTVQAKETLTRIAAKHHTSVEQLMKLNSLKNHLIRPGQVLRLRSGRETVVFAPKAPLSIIAPKATVVDEDSNADAVDTTSLSALPLTDRWKVMLFLDRKGFAPGKLDGKIGTYTHKATGRWIAAQPGRNVVSLVQSAQSEISDVITRFTIPEDALRFVGTVSTTLDGKAEQKKLPYESLAEYVAERYRTDLTTLGELNAGVPLQKLKVGDTVLVPATTPFAIESWQKDLGKDSAKSSASVRILHSENLLEVRGGSGALTACFPITVGTKPEHIRTGNWQVRSFAINPSFLWDDSMLKDGVAGKKQILLPPGPNNPVGILWMEIEPVKGPEAHIGIHGTNDPARIGRNRSSGCIRLANWDIVRLAKLIAPGTLVTWGTKSPASLDQAPDKLASL